MCWLQRSVNSTWSNGQCRRQIHPLASQDEPLRRCYGRDSNATPAGSLTALFVKYCSIFSYFSQGIFWIVRCQDRYPASGTTSTGLLRTHLSTARCIVSPKCTPIPTIDLVINRTFWATLDGNLRSIGKVSQLSRCCYHESKRFGGGREIVQCFRSPLYGTSNVNRNRECSAARRDWHRSGRRRMFAGFLPFISRFREVDYCFHPGNFTRSHQIYILTLMCVCVRRI